MSATRPELLATLAPLENGKSHFVLLFGENDKTANARWIYDYYLQHKKTDAHIFYLSSCNGDAIKFADFNKAYQSAFGSDFKWGWTLDKSWVKAFSLLKNHLKKIPNEEVILILDDIHKFHARDHEIQYLLVILVSYWKKHWKHKSNIKVFVSDRYKNLVNLTLESVPKFLTEAEQININYVLRSLEEKNNITTEQDFVAHFDFETNVLLARSNLEKNARRYGFLCENVREDGDCFFHAALAQLKKIDPLIYKSFTALSIRKDLIKHIEANQKYYASFIKETTGETFATYCNKMKKPGEWADNTIVSAFTIFYNMNLAIILSNNPVPQLTKRIFPKGTVYLGYEKEFHYQSLVPDEKIADALPLSFDDVYPSICEIIPEERVFAEATTDLSQKPNTTLFHGLFTTSQKNINSIEVKTDKNSISKTIS